VEYYGHVPASMRALVFFLNGELSGIGGYKIENGNLVVFSDLKEGVKVSKHTIWRCTKIIMDMVKEKGRPMYSVAENPELLKRLGFKQMMPVNGHDLFGYGVE